MVAKTIKVNNKVFYLVDTGYTKFKAKNAAEKLRRQGYLVRVIPSYSGGYSVYRRHKRMGID